MTEGLLTFLGKDKYICLDVNCSESKHVALECFLITDRDNFV